MSIIFTPDSILTNYTRADLDNVVDQIIGFI